MEVNDAPPGQNKDQQHAGQRQQQEKTGPVVADGFELPQRSQRVDRQDIARPRLFDQDERIWLAFPTDAFK